MDIIRIFGIVFLLIMAAGFIVAFSGKDDRKNQSHAEKTQPRVIVTQQVPSVFKRRDRRR